MKINISYDENQIIKLIQEDIERKIGNYVPEKSIEIFVRSKRNYREHTWEKGKLKCDLEVEI